MGCFFATSVANLFTYILEIKWLSLYPDLKYFRFIDDIFTILLQNLQSIYVNLEEHFFILN